MDENALLSNLVRQYSDRVAKISDGFTTISPEQVDSVINSGALGGTLGFRDARDVFGMTPETLNQSMQTYRSPIETMTQGAQMVEAVTGRGKRATSQLAAEGNIFNTSASFINNTLDRNQRSTEHKDRMNTENRRTDILENAELRAGKNDDVDKKFKEDSIELGKERNRLLRKKFETEQMAIRAGEFKGATPVHNPRLGLQYSNAATRFVKEDGSIKPGFINKWQTEDLRSYAYGGTPNGWVYDATKYPGGTRPEGYMTDDGSVYKSLTFVQGGKTPSGKTIDPGWYGIPNGATGEAAKNLRLVLPTPIVPIGSSSGGGTTTTDRYPGFADE